jgi:hypothetical protein
MPAARAAISYAHGGYDTEIKTLADRLNAEGVDCELDLYNDAPPEGLAQWMLRTLQDRIVIAVCTAEYADRIAGRASPGVGLGVAFEARILIGRVYEGQGRNEAIIPVVFRSEDARHIPAFLRDVAYYDLSHPDGYDTLYWRLIGFRRYEKPALGQVRYPSTQQKSIDEPSKIAVKDRGRAGASAAASAVPPATLSGRLQALYDAQSKKVRDLGLGTRDVRPKGLADIIAFGTSSIRAAIPAFKHSDDIGSWISSHSLPIQLLMQSHLTVDLTLHELRKERPFGIPFRSLFELADSGHLFLNLRDYDSDFAAHYDDERVAKNIDRLLTEIPTKLYIGSALRKAVFDAALAYSGYEEREYESFYDQALIDLAAAYAAYDRLPLQHTSVKRSLFRGERPKLKPVCWHWAFLNSVSHYLPPDIIRIEDDDAKLNSLYRKAIEYGDSARQDPSDVKNEAAADAFAELAGQLRICHLSFTAPITASYGTTYNMTEDEYRESLRLGFYWDRRAPSLRDDELDRFLYFALSDVGQFGHSAFSRLHELPDHAVLKDKIDDHIFTMGDIDNLIGALGKNRQRIAEANAIMNELKTSYLTDDRPAPRRLEAWISGYRRIKADAMNVCRTALGDKWAELVVPAEAGGVDPSSPWVETLGEDPQKLLLRPVEHRAIHRVYHILSRS